MTSRRAFLSTLAGASAGFLMDPERALWIPGKTSTFVIGNGVAAAPAWRVTIAGHWTYENGLWAFWNTDWIAENYCDRVGTLVEYGMEDR